MKKEKMKKEVIKNDFSFWRTLINLWSIIFFISIILDFFSQNAYQNILDVIATVYISSLALYVGNKEFERWYDKYDSKHPGEIFVVIWSVTVFALLGLSFIFKDTYQIPDSVVSSYLAVLTILVLTKKSKKMYQIKRSK
ncbi:MAG: hypothetical protein ACOYL8_02595 [Patescibacteria group bacterium]